MRACSSFFVCPDTILPACDELYYTHTPPLSVCRLRMKNYRFWTLWLNLLLCATVVVAQTDAPLNHYFTAMTAYNPAAVGMQSEIKATALYRLQWLGLDAGVFWSNMQNNIDWSYDVFNGLTKSLIFGSAVALIAVYQGFHCTPTAEGILRASTRTVVSSALTVLALDFILTAFMFT